MISLISLTHFRPDSYAPHLNYLLVMEAVNSIVRHLFTYIKYYIDMYVLLLPVDSRSDAEWFTTEPPPRKIIPISKIVRETSYDYTLIPTTDSRDKIIESDFYLYLPIVTYESNQKEAVIWAMTHRVMLSTVNSHLANTQLILTNSKNYELTKKLAQNEEEKSFILPRTRQRQVAMFDTVGLITFCVTLSLLTNYRLSKQEDLIETNTNEFLTIATRIIKDYFKYPYTARGKPYIYKLNKSGMIAKRLGLDKFVTYP